ncbi:MAG: hypothetical protein ACREGE_02830 [Candidatus Microsaccharimonas sp.]
MKRILAALAAPVVAALLLAGCATGMAPASAGTTDPVNLTDSTEVTALCGDSANEVLEYVTAAADAKPDSGKRNALKEWGIANPTDEAVLTEVIGALKVRASVDCETGSSDTASEDGIVGVENLDGSIVNLPLVSGTSDTLVIDTTTQAATPPLLDGSLRFTAQTLSWAGLVERVGTQQWFIDGINERAAQTGFTWDDVLKFASVNKMKDGKVQGVNALAIQVFNQPNLTDEQARDMVRDYFTPEVEKTIGMTVDELPIQRINNGFINTRQAGTAQSPKMGEYFDTQNMVRVSLMPIKFDEKGAPVGLDGSRGAGIFIDCGNLHWVPKAVWACTDSSCVKPQCPPGTTGTPPNCEYPKPVCPWNPNLPVDSPDCLQPKDWNKSPTNPGWIPLGPGELTDGNLSQDQKDNGDTSGNVIDNKVPEDTKSGDTTPDLPDNTVVAPDATPGGDDRTDDVVDDTVTNQDDGGTDGDTCITDPDTGESMC